MFLTLQDKISFILVIVYSCASCVVRLFSDISFIKWIYGSLFVFKKCESNLATHVKQTCHFCTGSTRRHPGQLPKPVTITFTVRILVYFTVLVPFPYKSLVSAPDRLTVSLPISFLVWVLPSLPPGFGNTISITSIHASSKLYEKVCKYFIFWHWQLMNLIWMLL